jgi:predicted metal-binding membrane protein
MLTALAWLALAGGARALIGALPGHGLADAHEHTAVPGVVGPHWGAAHWFAAWCMWAAMTVAMMLPAAAPAILSHAGAVAGAGARASLRQTGAFVAGYLAVWWAFGVLATALQWLLASSARHLPATPATATALAGCLLVLAGLYQFSPVKRRCLAHCRGRAGARGVRQSGLRHGLHCLGCCWALMALMLLGGAMSIGWTAALAAVMLAEKALPGGQYLGRAAGIVLVAWGSVLIAAV